MAVRIVTDSTSDIPPDMAEALGIHVVPLTVFFGDEAFKDGVEITRDEFFRRLAGNVLPRTTQPTVGDFETVYRALADEDHEIASIHVSSKLSGTVNSALTASAQLPEARVEIVDSGLVSLGLTLAVKAAAEAANAGGSLEEVCAAARAAAERVDLYFVLDTLEYLQKGGRIGKAAALMGGLLSIKPVLKVVDGEIHPHEKVRSRAKALARMREIASEGAPYEEIGLIHETSEEEAAAMAAHLAPLAKSPLITGRIGSVIGTYTGPGVVGFALRRA